MKTMKYMLCLGLIWMIGMAGFAQNANSSDTHRIDPKLSLKQQLDELKAGEDNPSKSADEVDPKVKPEELPSEKDFGEANANPGPESLEDPKLADFEKSRQQQTDHQTKGDPIASLPKPEQPEGEKTGLVINYRLISGGTDQPEGEPADKVLNYRNLKGDNKQPEGDPPH